MFSLHYKDTKFEAQSQVFSVFFSQLFSKIFPSLMTHPLPPLKRGDEFVPEILRRDAPLDDMPGG